ncbi:hypothetical protein FHS27_006482 [Rhodopirellula rubra]|uniref:Uncharacterized protein n=1 Tax=Aporhodopirellula rubra TaxID=980271 RepID=A0A7W5E6H5_9BACT|nr:hypothetical protein [Aporhodopirellula rubra]MBB3210634.1 hypothetical protein [Aporhodopirellula rubra]
MAFLVCPTCGAEYHALISDPETWYAERYPDVAVGSVVPGLCFDCFPDLTIGDTVDIRNHGEPLDGQTGAIQQIVVDPAGCGAIYFVRLPNGRDRALARCNLRKHREAPNDAPPASPKTGYF